MSLKNISKSLMRIILQRQRHFDKNARATYLRFVLVIVHGDRFDKKTPKTIVLFKLNLLSRLLKLVSRLLFEEMLV